MPLAKYNEHALETQQEGFAAGKWQQLAMTDAQLLRILNDPRGPEAITSGMLDGELAGLLDALYRNLDTPAPDPSAIFWYEIGVEESRRRDG
ncbi:hypothetical protein [Arthrobacter sp. ZGTC412]|uniref:hypothetical protein n=1 Tax=Arthrobacter sp. ZGTC412 TaxID=2058900 RepID=UPI002157B904|nr:hypothetical protein [Arthrobacter sp. ZGTC412]